MIVTKEIIKTVKDGTNHTLTILDKVSLAVREKEFIAICGKSGCGKSTLLSIIAGIDQPTKGEVLINGVKIYSLSESKLAAFRNENIGMVFQKFNLIPSLSIIENVEAPQYLAEKGKKSKIKAGHLLEILGLKESVHKKISHLSGGEQQRLAIARALIQEPKVLLADEPTGSLDQENSGKIMDLFTQIRKEMGVTILLVTHDEKTAKIADRIVYLT